LISYGPDQEEIYQPATSLVDRILKGARPAELPLEQLTRFRLVTNLKTATALGIELPATLLTCATKLSNKSLPRVPKFAALHESVPGTSADSRTEAVARAAHLGLVML
jgi:hypothetical protein